MWDIRAGQMTFSRRLSVRFSSYRLPDPSREGVSVPSFPFFLCAVIPPRRILPFNCGGLGTERPLSCLSMLLRPSGLHCDGSSFCNDGFSVLNDSLKEVLVLLQLVCASTNWQSPSSRRRPRQLLTPTILLSPERPWLGKRLALRRQLAPGSFSAGAR